MKTNDTMLTSSKNFYEQHRILRLSILDSLKQLIGSKKIQFVEEFEDESNNHLTHIDNENVYFDETESYPLGGLGTSDMIEVLAILED